MEIQDYFPTEAIKLVTMRAQDLLGTLGATSAREIVADVLLGTNIRDATEKLTKQRISLLNGALLATHVKLYLDGVPLSNIPDMAYYSLINTKLSKEQRNVLLWLLGLTQKQFDNVLRSDNAAWSNYIQTLKKGLEESSELAEGIFGKMPLFLDRDQMSWEWALSLMMSVGSQTLATRGSEKSLYGKLFEKLVLVSALSILGFNHTIPGEAIRTKSFWLSSTEKRESDATAIWNLGQGVRFDIGFIGKGNPEISMDKITRFESAINMGGINYYMRTFIIVDTVSKGSSVFQLATDINGVIIQMSANDWVQTLGKQLSETLDGYKSPLEGMNHSKYEETIRLGVLNAPLEDIIKPRR